MLCFIGAGQQQHSEDPAGGDAGAAEIIHIRSPNKTNNSNINTTVNSTPQIMVDNSRFEDDASSCGGNSSRSASVNTVSTATQSQFIGEGSGAQQQNNNRYVLCLCDLLLVVLFICCLCLTVQNTTYKFCRFGAIF